MNIPLVRPPIHETPEATRVETRTTCVNFLPDRSGIWCGNMALWLHVPHLVPCPVCWPPNKGHTHQLPGKTLASNSVILSTFILWPFVPGWLTICVFGSLPCGFSSPWAADLWPQIQVQLAASSVTKFFIWQLKSPVFCTGSPLSFCGHLSD